MYVAVWLLRSQESHSCCSTAVTTLGIVEFFLFLLAEYYPDYDKGRKDAFGAVHFALFETAILNAFMTVCTATVAMRVSHRIWVETELLEVNHYVEIREEFDRIDASNRNYQTLLIQIRFHQLRVQFIKSYNLPLQLKISNYLLSSEQAVLIRLVHISSTAWLLLTGAVCLLYYICGIIFYQTQDQQLLGQILMGIFFSSIALFIVVSLALSYKMRTIFQTILNEKWIIEQGAEKERLAEAQLALFWGSNPKHVIHIIQFMQFGYAVAIATVVIFWKEIGEGPIPSFVFLLAVVVCYSLFVLVTGRVIPQYTMCTSLGQLVNDSRLRETVALFRLEEAKQKRLEYLEYGDDDTTFEAGDISIDKPLHRHVDSNDEQTMLLPAEVPTNHDLIKTESLFLRDNEAIMSERRDRMERRRERRKSVSDGVAIMANLQSSSVIARNGSKPEIDAKKARISSGGIMAELVSLDTKSLRSAVPETPEERSLRHERMRKNRRKAASTGVAAMVFNDPILEGDGETGQEPRASRRRQKSLSAGVSAMALADHVSEGSSPKHLRATEERIQRKTRSRSSSKGVAKMAIVDPIIEGQLGDTCIEDHVGNQTNPRIKGKRVKSLSAGVSSMFWFANKPNNMVTFEDEAEAESSQVDSNATLDGYVSDEDNLPSYSPQSDLSHIQPPLRDRLTAFLLSDRYVFLSNVFGTIVAFLLVGERVEGFIQSQNFVSEDFVSLALPHEFSFWLLVGWIASCLSASIFIIFLYRHKQCRTAEEFAALLAACIDASLFSLCASLLLVGKYFLPYVLPKSNHAMKPKNSAVVEKTQVSRGNLLAPTLHLFVIARASDRGCMEGWGTLNRSLQWSACEYFVTGLLV